MLLYQPERSMSMKKMILTLCILFCTVLSAMPAFALMKNEPEGFRGIEWFASPKNDSLGLREKERMTVSTIYQRKGDKLRIGAAKLTAIEYIFLDNAGLVQVYVETEGEGNVDALIKACTENWGEPKKNRMYEVYTWVGKKVEAFLSVYENRDSADLHIGIKKISELFEEEEKRQAKEGKKDF